MSSCVRWRGCSPLRPIVLVAAEPELAINLLSATDTQTEIYHHYTAGLIPPLVAASCSAPGSFPAAIAPRYRACGPRRRRGSREQLSPGRLSASGEGCREPVRIRLPQRTSPTTTAIAERALQLIPEDAVVQRDELAGLPPLGAQAVPQLPLPRRTRGGSRPTRPSPATPTARAPLATARLARLRRNPRWRLVFAEDGVLVFQRRIDEHREDRYEHGVPRDDEPDDPLEREHVAVVEEPDLPEHERRRKKCPGRERARPGTSRTRGTSHTRYWGERKRLNARKPATAAANASTSASGFSAHARIEPPDEHDRGDLQHRHERRDRVRAATRRGRASRLRSSLAQRSPRTSRAGERQAGRRRRGSRSAVLARTAPGSCPRSPPGASTRTARSRPRRRPRERAETAAHGGDPRVTQT